MKGQSQDCPFVVLLDRKFTPSVLLRKPPSLAQGRQDLNYAKLLSHFCTLNGLIYKGGAAYEKIYH